VQSKTLSAAVQLMLDPLRIAKSASGSDPMAFSTLLDIIIENILSIPDLPNRVSRSGLTQLVVELPLVDILERINATQGWLAQNPSNINILANLLAIGRKRVPHLTKGAHVNLYLQTLTVLQDGVPSGLLHSSQQANGSAFTRALVDRTDEEGASPSKTADDSTAAASTISPATRTRLQILPSQGHISAILTASAKFPSSTRESLCSFLISTLQSWDAITCDHVLACITYRHGNTPASNTASKSGGISQHSIEGLVRELWRGWLRGSPLMRFLSSDLLQGRKALVDVLTNEKMKTTWPCLLVLCQLYSRSLLTIGDDEFYPSENTFGATNNATASASRNPLSLDEIIAFSGLLRNLGFSLYWYEGTGGILDDLNHCNVVGFKKMDLLSLRTIVTRLLQQLHQRDSRRKYAPKDHWLMSSHLDLNTFIESVVLEEDELNQYQDVEEGSSTVDSDMSEPGTTMTHVNARSGAAISSRIANRRGTNLRGGGYSARNLAYLSPRLGVLNNVPFMIPFQVRVGIFHQFAARDYGRLRRTIHRPSVREFSIRRSHVAEDGFTKLNGLGSQLKHRFGIQFIDQFGIEESGIDGGGLFKEFLTSLVKEAFDTDRGLWRATAEQQLYPNPHSYAKGEESLQWYTFLGRILGKALYHGILVDVNFASFFLSKWLGKGNGYLDDLSGLESLDKEVYKNLLWLKHYNGDVEKDLTLDFTVTDEDFGVKHTHALVPNGQNIAVTKENRLEYIYRVSHYRLNEQIRQQSEAFLSGLTDIIDLRWLRMLDREELRILISGSEGEIDLENLKANTELGGYHEKDEVVDFFWKALESFTHAQRKAFLKFVTSCPSPPLLGFAQLYPKFGIRHGGDDTTRLPTSSTCVNLLKLPRYTSYEQCREKLLYAIESGAGFDLS
jgi:ubiquitin-protein ligase E3 C